MKNDEAIKALEWAVQQNETDQDKDSVLRMGFALKDNWQAIQALYDEVLELRKDTKNYLNMAAEAEVKLMKSRAKVERYEAALRFYADKNNWIPVKSRAGFESTPVFEGGQLGYKAKQALEDQSGIGKPVYYTDGSISREIEEQE